MRTALSLQTEERLDLAELAEACIVAGFPAVEVHPWGINGLLPTYRPFAWKPGDEWTPGLVQPGLSAEFAFAMRDTVLSRIRDIEASGGHVLDQIDLGRFGWYRDARRWLDSPIEGFSTAGAARALVALFRAGLLPIEPEKADPHKSVGYIPPVCEDGGKS